MSKPAKSKKSLKQQLAESRERNRELVALIRRVFPAGRKDSPDLLWRAVQELGQYARWLASMAEPFPASSIGDSGRVAEAPIFAGVNLEPEEGRKGDRNLYHGGRAFDGELRRLIDDVRWILKRSEGRVTGLDLDTPGPHHRRPRCSGCGELMGLSWRLCPWCGTGRQDHATGPAA